jgi:O-antigen/teichoic acid export membrane protein
MTRRVRAADIADLEDVAIQSENDRAVTSTVAETALRRSLFSDAAPLFAARVISGGTTLLIFVALARLLSVEEVGLFSFAWSVSYVLATVSEAGYGMLVIREVAQRPGELGDYLAALMPIRLVSAVPVLVLAAGIAYVVLGPSQAAVVVLATFVGMLQLLAQTLRDFFIAIRRMQLSALLSITENVIRAIAVVSVALLTRSLVAVFVVLGLVYVVSTALTTAALLAACRPRSLLSGAVRWPRIAKQSAGFAIFVTVAALFFHVHTVVASAFLPLADVALLQAAMRIFFAAEYLPEAIARWAYPDLSRAMAHDPRRFSALTTQIAAGLIGVGIAGAIVIITTAPWFVPAMFGDQYRGAVLPMQILAVGIPVRFATHVYGTALSAGGRQVPRAVAAVGATAATVVAEVLFIQWFGIAGAAWSLAASSLILLSGYVVIARRSWKFRPATWPFGAVGVFSVLAAIALAFIR